MRFSFFHYSILLGPEHWALLPDSRRVTQKYYFSALSYFNCVLKQGTFLYWWNQLQTLSVTKKVTLWRILTLVITGKNIYSYGFNRQLYMPHDQNFYPDFLCSMRSNDSYYLQTLLCHHYPMQVCLHKTP